MERWEDEKWWEEKHPAHEVLIGMLWKTVTRYEGESYSGGCDPFSVKNFCQALRLIILSQNELAWTIKEVDKINSISKKTKKDITALLEDLRGRLIPQKTSKTGTSSRSPEPDLC